MEKKETIISNSVFFSITGWLAITADIAGLISFATGFISPNSSTVLFHPALIVIIQIALVIYGNIALSYEYVVFINKKYINRDSYISKDIKNTMLLFSYLIWIPSFIIWVVSCFLVAKGTTWFLVIVVISCVFAVPGGGYILSKWGSLIVRTLRPELPIIIDIE
jgi:hypothetical protein